MRRLRDEALLQIRIQSDDLDGATLRELAEQLGALFEFLIVLLIFTTSITRAVAGMARVIFWLIVALGHLPGRAWVAFWLLVASAALYRVRVYQG